MPYICRMKTLNSRFVLPRFIISVCRTARQWTRCLLWVALLPMFAQAQPLEWDRRFAVHGTKGEITAATVIDSGIVVGLNFSSMDRVRVNGLALWNGSRWQDAAPLLAPERRSLLTGLASMGSSTVIADGVIYLPDGTRAEVVSMTNGKLTVLPAYTDNPATKLGNTLWLSTEHRLGYLAAENIVVLDNNTWRSLSKLCRDGCNGTTHVEDAAMLGDSIIAIGRFNNYEGQPLTGIALHDGVTWRSLGAPNKTSRHLSIVDGEPYVSGSFDSIGGARTGNNALLKEGVWRSFEPGSDSISIQGALRKIISYRGGHALLGIVQANGRTIAQVATYGEGRLKPIYYLSPIQDILEYKGDLYAAAERHLLKMVGDTLLPVTPEGVYLGLQEGTLSLAAIGDTVVVSMKGDTAQLQALVGDAWGALTRGLGDWSDKRVLASSDGVLYYAGQFPSYNGKTMNSVMQYVNGAWENLGAGLKMTSNPQGVAEVHAMVAHNGELIVYGAIDSAGGKYTRNTARWDGQEWHAVDNVIVGGRPLGFYRDTLVFGWVYNTVTSETSNLGYWDGSSVRAWQQPANDDVLSMVSYKNGFVIGGSFTRVGGVAARKVAYWDGSKWNPLDTGLPNYIRALATDGERVYAAGSDVLSYWDGSHWQPLMTDMRNVNIDDLLTVGDKLYVAGSFIRLGDAPSFHFGAMRLPEPSSVEKPRSRSSSLLLFPNPASTVVRVSTAGSITIVDLLGRVVIRSLDAEVDVSSLPPGRYLVIDINGLSAPLEVCR